MRTALIVNPHSGGGSTAGRLDEIRTAASVLGDLEIMLTERRGHATELASRAVDAGFTRIIAFGGDGTANEVVNGLAPAGESRLGPNDERPVFALVNGGTGGDLVKTLKMPTGLPEAFASIAAATPRAVDLIVARFTDHQGNPAVRVSINVLGFGMNGAVVRRVNRSSKRLGGRVSFALATVSTLASFRPPRVRVSWEGEKSGSFEGDLSSAFVANGQYCGGGMWVGRGGSLDDGLVELTLIPDLPLPRVVLGAPRLWTGTMGHVKDVSTARIRSLTAVATESDSVLIDVDGEQPGQLPLEILVTPKALLVAGLW